jgi:GT2 family glycosyltransferase
MRAVGDIDPLCSFGGEELDYSIRMRVNGFGVLYTPEVIVKHNNFIRHISEDVWRRRMRVYNFTRLHFKHFTGTTAGIFALRYFISHFLTGQRNHGLRFAFSLLKAAFKGAQDGRRQYRPIPISVHRMYKSYSLQPDFGNVPISKKILKNINRRFRRSV